jgi:TPR repeat protein
MPSTPPPVDPTPPKIAPAPTEAEKPAPVTVAAQFAGADRAISERKFADAITILKTLADAGNSKAQVRLGDIYAEGHVVPRDEKAAESWYLKAAMAGDTGAQFKLGALYADAPGTARNNNMAYIWYGTAARLGYTAAQAQRDRIGALLQPAERAQADKVIEKQVSHMREQP